MKIYYGVENNKIEVTQICYEKLKNSKGVITIPYGDLTRASFFTDPLEGVHKSVFIVDEDTNKTNVFDEHSCVEIVAFTGYKITSNSDKNIEEKLNLIHSTYKLEGGTFDDELPEQKMAIRFLKGHEKVLEIGGNIGRNTIVISSILMEATGTSENLVVMECDPNSVAVLERNRELNNLNFKIEPSALSKRKLIQTGWNTTEIGEDDAIPDGYKVVDTISLDALKEKYKIDFDTLVLDCEGAFYYILSDMPEILNGVNLIIMENDYYDISRKQYIDKVLIENGFNVFYSEGGGWGVCEDYFFQVWKRQN